MELGHEYMEIQGKQNILLLGVVCEVLTPTPNTFGPHP
jgi:hypothetical protein